MITSTINEKLANLTSSPGVYLMKDIKGDIIYVGKAKNLKKRVSSYFNKSQKDMKTDLMVKKIHSFETVITAHEDEALLLENSLVKKHRPKYNIDLKDGNRYPFLRFDLVSEFPYLSVVRKMTKDGSTYFGPFTSPQAVRETIKLINKLFQLRKCQSRDIKKRTRPCLNFQMKTCLGPCSETIDRERYAQTVQEVLLFLKGKTTDLLKQIKDSMALCSQNQDYENAAIFRNRMFSLETILEKQVVVSTDDIDRDVIGLAEDIDASVITLLSVRNGILSGTRHFNLKPTIAQSDEILETFIRQYYENAPFIPKEILIPSQFDYENTENLETWLTQKKSSKVYIIKPIKGEKVRLIQMAEQNANNALNEYQSSRIKRQEMLYRLQVTLKMDSLPLRIECFDNSNSSGNDLVSAMVVFENGQPEKKEYRRYKIKSVTGPDDYAAMEEVLSRRFAKTKPEKEPDNVTSDDNVKPDLLVIDGGKGQLSVATNVLKKLNLLGEFTAIGIAKKKEGETCDKIYLPNRTNPIKINEDVLMFLQRIRDEAHRFAISYHRSIQLKRYKYSILDDIEGIGKKRKQLLLSHFGSVARIAEASVEDLTKLKGINKDLAEHIKQHCSEKG